MAPAGAMAPQRGNRPNATDLPALLLEHTHELLAAALTSTAPSTAHATTPQPAPETTLPPEPVVERTAAMFVYALFLVLIPTATILGNALVILSVLRFKALHSAINFLILGLAVADLFVAVFVMPYAVYVYIQGGNWFLGNLMCDIYNASDVACSTASIFLLAVISFDRYRAVSRPIQYSRQSQNIKRVIVILVLIWVVSLALASPIVLGLNHRPADASPYECRFYNPEFSVGSSIVSFIVPCIIVLFVYIRIMMALRKREKAAKMRRLASQQQDNRNDGSTDDVDAGQIVAAPDDHDVGNSSSPLSSSDSLSDNIHVVTNDFVSEAPTSMSRKSSEYESQHTNGTHPTHPQHTYHNRNRRLSRESSLLRNPMKRFKSLHVSPRNIALPTVDIARPADIWRHFSRRSPRIFGPTADPSPKLMQKKLSYAEEGLFGTTTPLLDAGRRKSDTSAFAPTPPNGMPAGIGAWVTEQSETQENEAEQVVETPKLPMSPKSPFRRFEGALTSAVLGEDLDYVDVDSMQGSLTGAYAKPPPVTLYSQETTSSVTDLRDEKIQEAAIEEEPANPPTSLNIMTVSSDEHSVLNDATIATDSGLGTESREHNEIVITNLNAKEMTEPPRKVSKPKRHEETGSPTVTFKIPGKHREKSSRNDRPMKRLSSAAQIYENKRTVDKNGDQEADLKHKRSFSQRLRGSLGAVVGPTNSRSEHSMDSCYSSSQSQGTNTTAGAGNSSGSKESKKGKILANSKANGSTTELAVRMVKKAINRKESSLKRKVNKAQRKEKRATKTLGIVVGIFLICWVPFFFINILSGICIKLNIESCQVGFGPFFYATWIGYMNSFMNPVIYTIFNTEFRRAFKSLLLGKSNNRRNRGHPV